MQWIFIGTMNRLYNPKYLAYNDCNLDHVFIIVQKSIILYCIIYGVDPLKSIMVHYCIIQ
jgi:hypothetical protein